MHFTFTLGLVLVTFSAILLLSNCNDINSIQSHKLGVVSWNVAEKSPKEINFLQNSDYDIVVIGVQELEDIRPRRHEGRRSKLLHKLQRQALGKQYVCIDRSKLGGIQTSIFIKKCLLKQIQDVQIIYVACGIGNVIVNKGAICTLLKINNKSLCVINSHLAAHQNKVEARNKDYARIMRILFEKSRPAFFKSSIKTKIKTKNTLETGVSKLKSDVQLTKSDKAKKSWDLEINTSKFNKNSDSLFDGIIFFGDLNYRLDCPRFEIEVLKNNYDSNGLFPFVKDYDQLTKQKCRNRALNNFQEDNINFMPTFKYDKGTNNFDSSGKYRPPAWTDRVLYKCRNDNSNNISTSFLQSVDYTSNDSNYSDHKPIKASFTINYN